MCIRDSGVIVQDTAWEGYEEIPSWIMQGYGTMASEAAEQLRQCEVNRPTHVFVQAGVGSLAGAVVGYFTNLYPSNPPKFVVMEASAADCLYQGAKAGDGSPRIVTGDLQTIMAGLACGEPNTLSWDILRLSLIHICADIHSVRKLYDAGIWPITMATTILKPGGYQRFHQIAGALADIDYTPWIGVDPARAAALVESIPADGHYRKPMKPIPSRKLEQKVPLIDCFTAPCRDGCPIHQDIPAYLMRVNAGKYEEALEVILRRNPLPFITGTICSHRCQDKCMRNAYDESVYIRQQKLKAAEGGFDQLLPKLRPAAPVPGRKVAVVGGGPAGMAAAFFLGRAGVDVTVFERKDALGGIVRHVIPEFRISGQAIDNDEKLLRAMGVRVSLNTEVKDVHNLFTLGYTHVILATGAWQKGSAGLEYGQETNVIEFLEAAKKAPDTLNLGRHVVVIGGGNTAMDAARAAKRIAGVESVSLVYRRTKRYMPCLLYTSFPPGFAFPLASPAQKVYSLVSRKYISAKNFL